MYLCQRAKDKTIVKLPSPTTIKRKISEMYVQRKDLVKKVLQQQETISFTMDMWASPIGIDIFGVIAHFITDKWEMQQVVNGFDSPSSSYTGEHMAEMFIEMLQDYDIVSKLSIITCDNASNTLRMGKVIEEYCNNSHHNSLSEFMKNINVIGCINHIIHLYVLDLLNNGFRSEALDSEMVNNIHKSGILDQIDDDDILHNPINKIRKGILKIRASTKYKKNTKKAARNIITD